MNRPTQVQKIIFLYLLILCLVVVVFVGQHFVHIAAINSEQSDNATIRLVENQEFAAEKLVQDARQLVASKDLEASKILRNRILTSAQKMLEQHEDLVGKNPGLAPRKTNSKEIDAIFFETPYFLNSQILQFLAQARALAETPAEKLSVENLHLKTLNGAEPSLLEAQSRLARQYGVENQEAIDRAKIRSFVILMALLILILVMGYLLFKPMGRRAQIEFDLLTESEGMIRAIVDSSLDAMVMCDSKGAIREWNPQAEIIFGWKKEDVLKRTLSEVIIPTRLRPMYDKGVTRYLSTGENRILNKRMDFELLHRSGREFPVELAIAPMKRRGEIYFSAFIKDITNQKLIQEELKKYQEHLEELLSERTQQLEANFQRLKASEQLATIGELAARVAHEIKNPLAAIRGGIRLLARNPDIAGVQSELMDDLVKETRRLDETVNDLLNLARPLIVKKVKVNLNTFLEESAESWKLQREVSKHKIQIEGENGLSLRVDLRLMGQILNNLVVNAAQAMKTPGTIKIFSRHKHSVLFLTVTDTGPGIPESSFFSLFTPFYTTKTRGTGLGLAICKKNVEAMDGNISVQSAPGQGASFLISLPLEEPEESFTRSE